MTEFIRRIMRKKHLRPPAEAEASISFARDLKMNWELYLFLVPFSVVFSDDGYPRACQYCVELYIL